MTTITETKAGELGSGGTVSLAEWVTSLEHDALPEEVVHEAKRALLDWLSVTLAGANERSTNDMVRVLVDTAGHGDSALIGREETLPSPFAALVNGFAAHVHDFDDTYNPPKTTFHGSSPLWPVIAAMSAKPGISGKLALTSFIAGFEVEGRVAEAAGPGHYEGGWHVTGTAGHVGAAVVAGLILGMEPLTLASAIGLSGTQAAGLKTSHGTDGKPFHAGKAAMDGLLSALLVQGGMRGSTKVIEGQFGILWTMAPGSSTAPLLDGIGTRWHLPGNGYKAYPSGSLTHPMMDAILELRAQHGFTVDDVEKVTAYIHSYAAAVTHYKEPKDRLEGRFSMTHAAATALLHDQPSIDDYTDEAVTDPRTIAARELLEIVVDDSVGKQGARVTITLKDGREYSTTVKFNRGTPDNPLTDDDLAAKFRAVAEPRIGSERAERLLELTWGVLELPDFSGIVQLASGSPR